MKTKHNNRILNLVVLVALVILTAPMAGMHAAAQTLPIEALLNSDGTINASTGASGAFNLRGWNVTLDSKRGPLLTRGDTPAAWSALAHNGLNSRVNALAVIGSDLYVGGGFSGTADGKVTNLNNIAKYSGGAWSALAHNGLDREVWTLAVIGTDLYAGGDFFQTADGKMNMGEIAKYSTLTNTWSAFPDALLANSSDSVYALAVMGNDLYVGGLFCGTTDNVTLNLCNIARYSGGAWSALANNGLSWTVRTLAVSGSDLYAGGDFIRTADHTITNLNYIAKYSGGAWLALPHTGLNWTVRALAVSGSDLYVGGDFTQTGDGKVTNLYDIAKLSNGAWSAFAHNGLGGGSLGATAFAVNGSDLYVGGDFTRTADSAVTTLNGIAKYSGGEWSALANNGIDTTGGNYVKAFAVIGSGLYIGGDFYKAADGTVDMKRVAKCNIVNCGVIAMPGFANYLPLVIK